jgi:RNA polymerase sigma-70 factor (ECF subfamily)
MTTEAPSPAEPFTPERLAAYIQDKRPQLLAYIARSLGDALRKKVEPEDLLQEVSMHAVRSLAEADLSKGDPFSWLCQIAEHRIIDAHRRFFQTQKRDAGKEVSIERRSDEPQKGGLIDMLVASMTTASQAFSRDQRYLRLAAALDKLPEIQRQALRLRYVEGLSSKEVAERIGKTDGAVRVMLTRSIQQLQTILGEQ